MSQSVDAPDAAMPSAASEPIPAPPATTHPTDRPVPLWPEGVLVAAAAGVLLVVALRHRVFLQRKYEEIKRATDEFQRQGGLDDLAQVARQAQDLLKGK